MEKIDWITEYIFNDRLPEVSAEVTKTVQKIDMIISQQLDDMKNASNNVSRVIPEHCVKKTKRRSHGNIDCNLMIFGRWETKDDYGSEVSDVFEYLDIHETNHKVQIVRNRIDISNDGKVEK